jgi:cytidylate kinase
MIIALWWKEWAWKWTCATMIAEKLGYEHISIWWIKRELAEKMWVSISEFDKEWEKPENIESYDKKYEDFQKNLPLESKIILDSRLSYRCQPNAFKVFLDVDPLVSAQRIFNARRATDNYASVEEVLEITKKRNEDNNERYKRLYNTDPSDLTNYDIIVDTTYLTPKQSVHIILKKFEERLSHNIK